MVQVLKLQIVFYAAKTHSIYVRTLVCTGTQQRNWLFNLGLGMNLVITSLKPNLCESTDNNKAQTTLKRRGSKAVLKMIQETKPLCIQPSKSYRTLTLLIVFKQSEESVATMAALADCQYVNKGCPDFTALSLILCWKFDQPSYHLILLSANHPDRKQKNIGRKPQLLRYFSHISSHY